MARLNLAEIEAQLQQASEALGRQNATKEGQRDCMQTA